MSKKKQQPEEKPHVDRKALEKSKQEKAEAIEDNKIVRK